MSKWRDVFGLVAIKLAGILFCGPASKLSIQVAWRHIFIFMVGVDGFEPSTT